MKCGALYGYHTSGLVTLLSLFLVYSDSI